MTVEYPDYEDFKDQEGLTKQEWEQRLLGQLPPPPEPKPLPPAVTRIIVGTPGLMAAGCAWYGDHWVRLIGLAFAVLFLSLAILPARRRR